MNLRRERLQYLHLVKDPEFGDGEKKLQRFLRITAPQMVEWSLWNLGASLSGGIEISRQHTFAPKTKGYEISELLQTSHITKGDSIVSPSICIDGALPLNIGKIGGETNQNDMLQHVSRGTVIPRQQRDG